MEDVEGGLRERQGFTLRIEISCSEPIPSFPDVAPVPTRVIFEVVKIFDGSPWGPSQEISNNDGSHLREFSSDRRTVIYRFPVVAPNPMDTKIYVQVVVAQSKKIGPDLSTLPLRGPCHSYNPNLPLNLKLNAPYLGGTFVNIGGRSPGLNCSEARNKGDWLHVMRRGKGISFTIHRSRDDRRLGVVQWRLFPVKETREKGYFPKWGTDCKPFTGRREALRYRYESKNVRIVSEREVTQNAWVEGAIESLDSGTVGIVLHGLNTLGDIVSFDWAFFPERIGGVEGWINRQLCDGAAKGTLVARIGLVVSHRTLKTLGYLDQNAGKAAMALELLMIHQGLDETGEIKASIGIFGRTKEDALWKAERYALLGAEYTIGQGDKFLKWRMGSETPKVIPRAVRDLPSARAFVEQLPKVDEFGKPIVTDSITTVYEVVLTGAMDWDNFFKFKEAADSIALGYSDFSGLCRVWD